MNEPKTKDGFYKIKWLTYWENQPVAWKFFMEITLIAVVLFAGNLFIYKQINQMAGQMGSVYMSNVNLSELSDGLLQVQNYMYQYLQVRDSSSLANYYRAEQTYGGLLKDLNTSISDNPIQILEKNICKMSESYITLTGETIRAKRGQNVERYKSLYESALKLYKYIENDISVLNSKQFKNNSASFQTLMSALRYMEITSFAILIIFMAVFMTIITVYIDKIREGAAKEQEMKKRELLMEAHLKEAQLEFLQSQINPHFLFNSLNAGVQLAVMENAEKTSVFMDKMADFFRYNVKKGTASSTVKDEVEAVENYIYILNVRFAGDILYHSDIDETTLDFPIPSMILQPLVENSVTHGIRNMERPGAISLTVRELENDIEITVLDNGKGIAEEVLFKIRSGERVTQEAASTGIGLSNVISRLRLFYNDDTIFNIFSEGEGKGTSVVLKIPKSAVLFNEEQEE